MIYVVSACLLGNNCKYNGGNNYNENISKICEGNLCVAICPETFGGLKTPRTPAEITGGSGDDVLEGKARVLSREGKDVTSAFINGAYACIDAIISAADEGEEIVAILKAKSPSCGSGKIYDGSFSGTLIDGDGVTAALLKKKGIKILTENDI